MIPENPLIRRILLCINKPQDLALLQISTADIIAKTNKSAKSVISKRDFQHSFHIVGHLGSSNEKIIFRFLLSDRISFMHIFGASISNGPDASNILISLQTTA